ncbi:MAG: hypothetical protein FWC70_09840 [Defluviitaleaceae bacterium]|nr:hypothetical protein [Defluviitaleaceae bacterium]
MVEITARRCLVANALEKPVQASSENAQKPAFPASSSRFSMAFAIVNGSLDVFFSEKTSEKKTGRSPQGIFGGLLF